VFYNKTIIATAVRRLNGPGVDIVGVRSQIVTEECKTLFNCWVRRWDHDNKEI